MPHAPEPLRFVVNLHEATTRHFDLRLEVAAEDGPVLASWAVPKGPSLDPSVRRLAIRVDDHTMAHLDLEGRDQDADRAHTKIVWDAGTYVPAQPPAEALEAGRLRFALAGEKLRGVFVLVRTRMGGQDRNWLLAKIDDEHARPGHAWSDDEHVSVLSGLRNTELP